MGFNFWMLAAGATVAGIAVPMLWPRRRGLAWILLAVGVLLILVGGGRIAWPWVLRWPFEAFALFLVACLSLLFIAQKLRYQRQLQRHKDDLAGIAEGIRRFEIPSLASRKDKTHEGQEEQQPETSRTRMRSGREIPYDGSRSPVIQQTIYQMAEKVAGCTDHEGERLLAPFIGKWLPIEGPIKNAATTRGRFHLTLHTGESPWVDCEFELTAVSSVEHLSRSDQVRLIGRISIATKRGFTLERCEVF